MADANQNYFTTSAPLVAGVVVVCGIGGGDVRGYFSPRSIWRQEKNCGDSELSQSKASPDPKLGRAVHLIAVATQDGSRDGTPRKLLVQANRNRFFSVLDRLLSAKPSVEKLTWASEVNSRDRAVVKGQSGPGTKEQELVPSCGMFVKEPEEWEEVRAVPRPMDPHSRFVQSISIPATKCGSLRIRVPENRDPAR